MNFGLCKRHFSQILKNKNKKLNKVTWGTYDCYAICERKFQLTHVNFAVALNINSVFTEGAISMDLISHGAALVAALELNRHRMPLSSTRGSPSPHWSSMPLIISRNL